MGSVAHMSDEHELVLSLNHLKADTEGEYVASLIERKLDPPRSLPSNSLRRLYTLSPNSRYSIGVGFFFIGFEVFLALVQLHGGRYSDTRLMMVGCLLLVLLGFGLPLVYVRRLTNAIESGINTTGIVDRLANARDTPYSTPAGMTNGEVKATISYSFNGRESSSTLVLDRAWVAALQPGTELKLLVDPNKPAILYVVGVVDRKRWQPWDGESEVQ